MAPMIAATMIIGMMVLASCSRSKVAPDVWLSLEASGIAYH